MPKICFIAVLQFLVLANLASATTWHIGATKTYRLPSQVMPLVLSGDTVEIDAGLYSGDVGTWRADNLVIRCAEGFAHLAANGKNAQGKAIWVVAGKHTYIEGIEFSDCKVPDSNGAGIRQEGNGLELRRCFFHDNQDGILGGGDSTSDVLIESCEFFHNGVPQGSGSGYAHNMYIGHIHNFTLKYCYSHGAWAGHDVKTRAWNNYVLYNLIADSADGTASFNIDIPNGGRTIVMGNIIWKGPKAENSVLVNYGEEGVINPDSELFVINNTMISERANTRYVANSGTSNHAQIKNNILGGLAATFNGQPALFSGPIDSASNRYAADPSYFAFTDMQRFDFRPSSAFPRMKEVTDAGSTQGFALFPIGQYVHPMDSAIRSPIFATIGACYFRPNDAVLNRTDMRHASTNYPDPFSKTTKMLLPAQTNGTVRIEIINDRADVCRRTTARVIGGEIQIDRGDLAAGVYFYRVFAGELLVASGRMVIQ